MPDKPRDLRVYDSVLETIGWTPLIRLTRVTRGIRTPVWAKAETYNPGGSVKDRIGIPIIEQAERDGSLKPGGTIVEGTSGNTGVALAIVAALRGYKCIFTMPDKMSQEKVRLLKAYGAEVVTTHASGSFTRRATLSATCASNPDEPPENSPSSRVSRRAIANASRSDTVWNSSMMRRSSVSGILSCPMPSTLYGTPSVLFVPPLRQYSARIDPTGSPQTTWIFGFFSLRKRPAPVMVPPVPAPAMRCVMRPCVCS